MARWIVLFLVIVGVCIVVIAPRKSNLSEFVSPDGKFRLKLPGIPKEKEGDFLGENTKGYFLEQELGSFSIVYRHIPDFFERKEANIEKLFDDWRDSTTRKAAGKYSRELVLKHETKVTVDGKYPGRDWEVQIPKLAKNRTRAVLAERSLFVLTAAGTEDWSGWDKVSEVFESFHCLP